ncbi:MAG: hypothetical protein IPM88_01380 [Nitrospira sp.]|nr:hypothetical protein [Nitrospira sp.]
MTTARTSKLMLKETEAEERRSIISPSRPLRRTRQRTASSGRSRSAPPSLITF